MGNGFYYYIRNTKECYYDLISLTRNVFIKNSKLFDKCSKGGQSKATIIVVTGVERFVFFI